MEKQKLIDNPFMNHLDPAEHTFAYEVLKTSFPEVDGLKVRGDMKEFYMSEEEFEKVMGASKADWDSMKLHKRERKKKDVGLF